MLRQRELSLSVHNATKPVSSEEKCTVLESVPETDHLRHVSQTCRQTNHDAVPASDIMDEAADEIEKLRSLVPLWIPLAEQMPELDQRVMVANASDEWVAVGSRQITGEYAHWDGDDYEELCEPTHWMPLPEPPEVT